ncbi:MAG TPA: nickel pincer cofactor biosynthesis protein LarB [Firmicutes bacterium]|jgi:NCAIR mutase (PurE)-related protein|nr:nickel pincer cofactor biosynthesis protein LarB [Bacillota bacterium]
MDNDRLQQVLIELAEGKISVPGALGRLRNLPYEDLGYAKLDHHRALRTGAAEVIFCQGKTPEQVIGIVERLRAHHDSILATRLSAQTAARLAATFPDVAYHDLARLAVIGPMPKPANGGTIAVVSAGTADIPVAEEAALTAEFYRNRVQRVYDVGVAGIHRLLGNLPLLQSANALIVVAGMEGALPSVVAGLVSRPVIAVPTSVGYGASFGGVAALLTMLNSCASGVGVVNIDNGFGAARLASLINEQGREG